MGIYRKPFNEQQPSYATLGVVAIVNSLQVNIITLVKYVTFISSTKVNLN